MTFSKKQKLNTHSSTESELVGIDDLLGDIMWGLYVLEAQGYPIEHKILLQDNKSIILLSATNCKMSSSRRTKHINNRFFLVKDKIDRGELKVQCEPTTRMWSDVLTKPKQGIVFYELRGYFMNCPTNYDNDLEWRNMHPSLLPKDEDKQDLSEKDQKTIRKAVTILLFCRSVKQKTTTRSMMSR